MCTCLRVSTPSPHQKTAVRTHCLTWTVRQARRSPRTPERLHSSARHLRPELATGPTCHSGLLVEGRWLPWLGPANSCKERGRVRRPKWALTGHGSRCWQGVLSAPIWPERCRPGGGRSFSPPYGRKRPAKGRALFQPSVCQLARARPAKGDGALSALRLSAGPGTASQRGGRSFSPPPSPTAGITGGVLSAPVWPECGKPWGGISYSPPSDTETAMTPRTRGKEHS